jgi:hypothetical protein
MPELNDEHCQNNKGGDKLQGRKPLSSCLDKRFLVRIRWASNAAVIGSYGRCRFCVV